MKLVRATVLLLFACHSDNTLNPFGDGSGAGNGPSPDITVWPAEIDFGSASVVDAEAFDHTITIANNGQADLEITGTRLLETEGTGFVAGEPTSIVIAPGGAAELLAYFRPRQYTLSTGALMIDSNDPDEPQVAVALYGVGIAPAISIDPEELDMGVVGTGCTAEERIAIENVGNDTLVVDHLAFSATSTEIVLDDVDGATLEPGQRKVVTVTYTPDSDLEVHGVLSAFSNDPADPIAMASQVGLPGEDVERQDSFEEPEQPMTDILFVIDNSNSMTPFQEELARNGQTFMDELSEQNSDWQVGVVTVDSPSLRGPVITAHMDDMADEFAWQVQAGTDAATDEYQLYRAWQTLGTGGEFGSYLRDDAALAVILVSDEKAQDPGTPRTQRMTHEAIDFYIDFLYGLKDDDSLVAIDVVGSPVPIKCDPAKDEGWGLDYAWEETGGIFFEICDTDWGPGLASMAAAAVPDLRMFHLSADPVVETIEVTVDDVPAGTLEYYYDEIANAVVFYTAPDAGSIIVLDYTMLGDCEQ